MQPHTPTPTAATLRAQKKADLVKKCFHYWLKDLTPAEIAKLAGCNVRTVQKIISENDFDQSARPQTLPAKIAEQHGKGLCPAAIAKALRISRTTVYKYLPI